MSFMSYFKKNKPSKGNASVAKERLQIIVAHQRSENNRSNTKKPEYLERLQLDILDVVKKYVKITENDITLDIEQHGDSSVIELNIALPEYKISMNKNR